MERKINTYLRKWKKDVTRKPLLIYGNKQVGKTYTALKFGEDEYKNIAYFNCDNNLELINSKLLSSLTIEVIPVYK